MAGAGNPRRVVAPDTATDERLSSHPMGGEGSYASAVPTSGTVPLVSTPAVATIPRMTDEEITAQCNAIDAKMTDLINAVALCGVDDPPENPSPLLVTAYVVVAATVDMTSAQTNVQIWHQLEQPPFVSRGLAEEGVEYARVLSENRVRGLFGEYDEG